MILSLHKKFKSKWSPPLLLQLPHENGWPTRKQIVRIFRAIVALRQVIVGKGTHAGPGLGEGANQPNVHKHETIYARIKPFFLALILTHGPIRLPSGENFCGHQQYKQAGKHKSHPPPKPAAQPFFPLFQVLDQSGCKVEIIFVTTNSLLKQAKKKRKKKI